jgi:hypothetical protein
LDGPQRSPEEKHETMYATILRSCTTAKRHREKKDLLKHFKMIVGSTMLLFSPMAVETLGAFLFRPSDDAAKKNMDKIVAPLFSVIDAQNTGVVVPVHLSFRDFLLDKNRCRKAPEF